MCRTSQKSASKAIWTSQLLSYSTLLLDEDRVLFKNEQNMTKTSQTNFSSALRWGNSLWHFTQAIVHHKIANEGLGRWTNPRHLQCAHPMFLGSDVYIAQDQLKRDYLVQWEQILRQPVRLKPCCDGSVILVKLVFQEGKKNEALHHRISFGHTWKSLCCQLYTLSCGTETSMHKAGLNKKIL